MLKQSVMIALAMVGMAFATPSFALEGCTCAGMALNGAKVLGTVDAASGAVTLDGAKAEAGMVLKNGSTIATGKEGSASLSVSGCSVPMTAASSVSVSQTGPDVCVKLLENGKLVTEQQFAGVLPGEQHGATSQATGQFRIDQDLDSNVRETAEWNAFVRAALNVGAVVGATGIVIGGSIYSFVRDDGVVCVSAC